MKKVMYVITSLSHKRVFESFVPRDDMEQMILGPEQKITGIISGVVPEDYSDFKIKKRYTYKHSKEIQVYVDKYKPDIFVQASLPCAKGIKLPAGCKKVYVSHGMVGNHVKGIIKKAGFDTSVWKGCDLYCGVSSVFADWVKHVAKVGDDKILLNALPQLDIIHDPNYYNLYRQKVLTKTKHPNAKKVLLYVGFEGKDRCDFVHHNEDYFRTAIELEKIARDNDWLVMIKPRHTFKSMMNFLRTHSWGKKYIKSYPAIQDSKYLHFITTTGHIFRYFFADVIVINGTSTVEVEACAINKPLVVVRTQIKKIEDFDPYSTVSERACVYITELSSLLYGIKIAIVDSCPNSQNRLIDNMGIKFDGKMHKRIQDRLARM